MSFTGTSCCFFPEPSGLATAACDTATAMTSPIATANRMDRRRSERMSISPPSSSRVATLILGPEGSHGYEARSRRSILLHGSGRVLGSVDLRVSEGEGSTGLQKAFVAREMANQIAKCVQ